MADRENSRVIYSEVPKYKEEKIKQFMQEQNDKPSNRKRKRVMQNVSEKRRRISKEHICQVCDVVFSQKGNLNVHIAAIHEGKKSFNCDICNTQFTSKHGMKGHISAIHEGKKKCKGGNSN